MNGPKLPALNRIPIYSGLSTKQKNTVKLLAGGVVSVGVFAGISWVLSNGAPKAPPPEPKAMSPEELNAPGGGKVDPEAYWVAKNDKRMDELEKFVATVKADRNHDAVIKGALDGQPSSPVSVVAAAASAASAPATQTPTNGMVAARTGQTATSASQAFKGSLPAGVSNPTPYPKQSQIASADGIPRPTRYDPNAPGANMGLTSYPPGSPNGAQQGGRAYAAASTGDGDGVGIISVTVATAESESDGKPKDGQARGKFNVNKNFLPVGFVRAKLLGGIDAATGGQAQEDPQPMLFLIQDDAILPNGWRGKTRNCFVVAAGTGDISSERAKIRLINLSCVKPNGDVLETTVKGTVYGEDGKAGMRGTIVTKQGQILANAMMAGIASGIGKGFGNQGITTSTSPLGVTQQQSTDASVVLRNSVAQGFGGAMDRLAQYWIDRADKMFPVVEIDAGRTIDIAFTKGTQLEIVPGDDDQDQQANPTARNLTRSASVDALIGENK